MNVLVVVCVCLEHSLAALTRVTDTAIQDERDSSFVSCVVGVVLVCRLSSA